MTIDQGPKDLERRPPLGGASLECMLLCRELRPAMLPKFLGALELFGFRLRSPDPLLLYKSDPISPAQVAQAWEVSTFVQQAEILGAYRCIANLTGQLVDTPTTLSIVLELKEQVIVISVPEDVLWGFDQAEADVDFQKLRKFADACEAVAAESTATLGYLGTEEKHPDDLTADSAQECGVVRVDEFFFSDVKLRELCEWYRNVYTKRWD